MKKKNGPAWLMALPLYFFTLVFVLGPLVYMVVLSFLQRAEVWGVTGTVKKALGAEAPRSRAASTRLQSIFSALEYTARIIKGTRA